MEVPLVIEAKISQILANKLETDEKLVLGLVRLGSLNIMLDSMLRKL